MIDLDQPIIPGRSAGSVIIGELFSEVAARIATGENLESFRVGSRYVFGPMTLWIEKGRISQIGVAQGYRGKINGAVGIGSKLAEVQAAFGEVLEDEEDNLVVPAMPGWAFETTEWLNGQAVHQNPEATISKIYVFAPKGRPS